jgi:O-antigen biosynthesis protein
MGKYSSFNPNPYSTHTQIVQFIDGQKKVLDVGCADGHLSKKIQSNNSEVVGIEIDQIAAKEASKYCKELICGDVESTELSDKYISYFDFIIFSDVLEHLKEPLMVLKRFKKYLKDDGYVIIALPNISNWRLRVKFLFGNFEYEDKGLLDRSHIRFFNEKSAKKLLQDADLEIYKFDLTVGDVKKRYAKFFHYIGTLWPNFLAYQFLIIAKKVTNVN